MGSHLNWVINSDESETLADSAGDKGSAKLHFGTNQSSSTFQRRWGLVQAAGGLNLKRPTSQRSVCGAPSAEGRRRADQLAVRRTLSQTRKMDDPLPCVTLRNGVRMPILGLGECKYLQIIHSSNLHNF